jgi:hypothetical protein
MIIPKIVFPWAPIYIKLVFWLTLSVSQWYLIYMDVDRFCLIVSFKIPNPVKFSVHNGIAGCWWHSSMGVTLNGAPLWVF